jgi:hypothetical protein
VAARNVYDFLSPHDPMPGGLLVMEGWVPDYVLRNAIEELQQHPYKGIVVTGEPVEKGTPRSDYSDYATLTVATLERMGVDRAILHTAPWPAVKRDRTYASAVALRTWLREHDFEREPINLMCLGPHSRRSRLLYERTLGTRIGVIAVEERAYDPARWWSTSAGFRGVVGEILAYLYARFVFKNPET